MAQKNTENTGSVESTEMDTLMTDKIPSTDATHGDSDFPTVSTETGPRPSRSCNSKKLLVSLILILSLVVLGIGISLVIISNSRCTKSKKSQSTHESKISNICVPSEEAKRVRLFEFLEKVKRKYFELNPNVIVLDPSASAEKIKVTFQPYDSRPNAIKRRTDEAFNLLAEVKNISLELPGLKPRERKLLSQVKFYLSHVFGQPYDGNYYAGDWMLGPNFFCFQPICSLGMEMRGHLPLFAPKTFADLERLEQIFDGYKKSILQYIENLKLGVKAGMVRSVEECKAGLDVFKASYQQVNFHNATGILQEPFLAKVVSPKFFSHLSSEASNAWIKRNGKPANETTKESLVRNIGTPLETLLSYLEGEYSQHCVPSNVSSGLANRPLAYVYIDGVRNTSQPTSQRLPTGEKLDGIKTYASIMTYYTDINITPNEVYNLGWEVLNKIYPQIVAIAKEVTGKNNTDAAIKEFRKKLVSQEMFYNSGPLPKNESGPDAFRKCSSLEGAKKHCPKRWEALQKWFQSSREVMSLMDPKTINMFYFAGDKHTTPNCPITLSPDFIPSMAAQSYENSDPMCTQTCKYNVPFFLENMGPTFSDWTVNAHEARPGHHTQVQGYMENFLDPCGGVGAWLNQVTPSQAFSEGWALYAENLIGEETDTYDGRPLKKYGWLKWQVWRALRLIIDSGLHSKGLTRQQGLDLFDKYAWDNSDIPQKELTRYQSGVGQATAYMIGQLAISKLRRYTNNKLGKNFDLKDFHYQVLRQGSAPLSFLTRHIEHYVECKQDSKKPGCDYVLHPPKSTGSKRSGYRTLDGITVALPKWPFTPKGYL